MSSSTDSVFFLNVCKHGPGIAFGGMFLTTTLTLLTDREPLQFSSSFHLSRNVPISLEMLDLNPWVESTPSGSPYCLWPCPALSLTSEAGHSAFFLLLLTCEQRFTDSINLLKTSASGFIIFFYCFPVSDITSLLL